MSTLFRLAVAVLAVHVIDDSFIQPQSGTSAGDHLVSGLLPLALLALAAWAFPRLRGGWRGALGLSLGVLGVAMGVEGFYYAREVGPSGDDFTGLLCFPAGALLLALGAITLWRTRRTEGRLGWRYLRRGLIAAAGFVAAFMVAMIGFGYSTTHVGRAVVPPDRLGVALVRLPWSPALAAPGAAPLPPLPPGRVVLTGVDRAAALGWGWEAGITLFEGRLLRG
jgi:hypothetical protein